jgi:hypothetical protein
VSEVAPESEVAPDRVGFLALHRGRIRVKNLGAAWTFTFALPRRGAGSADESGAVLAP